MPIHAARFNATWQLTQPGCPATTPRGQGHNTITANGLAWVVLVLLVRTELNWLVSVVGTRTGHGVNNVVLRRYYAH